jgi:hypothetical protein
MKLKGVAAVASALAMTLVLAGCGSIGAIGVPWKRDRAAQPQQVEPLPAPTSTEPIQSSDLSAPGQIDPNTGLPVESSDLSTEPLAPPAGAQTSLDAPGAGAGTVSRTDLLGGWTVVTQGDSCQLFMTLTSWTGGYRASTRGCNGPLLKSISAWNLQDGQVILAGKGGAPVARLTSSGNNRFDGQANGQVISFYR